MRVIVVGGGRVGLEVLRQALAARDEPVLVDRDPDRATRAHRLFTEARVIRGDATEATVLREANAPPADALVATTPDDPTNLMVATLARTLGIPVVVARSTEEAKPLFEEIGATPVPSPSALTGERLYRAFEIPGIRTFMPVGSDVEVVTLVVEAGSKLVGKSVREAQFPRESLLVAVHRGGTVLVPTADFRIEDGDVLTLVARKHLLAQLVDTALGTAGLRLPKALRSRR